MFVHWPYYQLIESVYYYISFYRSSLSLFCSYLKHSLFVSGLITLPFNSPKLSATLHDFLFLKRTLAVDPSRTPIWFITFVTNSSFLLFRNRSWIFLPRCFGTAKVWTFFKLANFIFFNFLKFFLPLSIPLFSFVCGLQRCDFFSCLSS